MLVKNPLYTLAMNESGGGAAAGGGATSNGSSSNSNSSKHNLEAQEEAILDGYVAANFQIGHGTYSVVRCWKHKSSEALHAIKTFSYANLDSKRMMMVMNECLCLIRMDALRQVEDLLLASGGGAGAGAAAGGGWNRFENVFCNDKTQEFCVALSFAKGGLLFDALNEGKFSKDTQQQKQQQSRIPDEDKILRVFERLTSVVAAMERYCVTHRDLKLENVMYHEKSEGVTLVDFGFARSTETSGNYMTGSQRDVYNGCECSACTQLLVQQLLGVGYISCEQAVEYARENPTIIKCIRLLVHHMRIIMYLTHTIHAESREFLEYLRSNMDTTTAGGGRGYSFCGYIHALSRRIRRKHELVKQSVQDIKSVLETYNYQQRMSLHSSIQPIAVDGTGAAGDCCDDGEHHHHSLLVIFDSFLKSLKLEKRRDNCGSPHYTAPEVLLITETIMGTARDVWSLGVILYSLLEYVFPFDVPEHLYEKSQTRQYVLELNSIIITEHVRPASPRLSHRSKALLRHLLDKKPQKRPSASSILRDYFSPSKQQQQHENGYDNSSSNNTEVDNDDNDSVFLVTHDLSL